MLAETEQDTSLSIFTPEKEMSECAIYSALHLSPLHAQKLEGNCLTFKSPIEGSFSQSRGKPY